MYMTQIKFFSHAAYLYKSVILQTSFDLFAAAYQTIWKKSKFNTQTAYNATNLVYKFEVFSSKST